MKKLRRAVLLGMMICSLTACGKDENNTRDKRISEPYTVVEGVTIVFGTEYVTTEETTMSPDTEPEIDDETKQTADSRGPRGGIPTCYFGGKKCRSGSLSLWIPFYNLP